MFAALHLASGALFYRIRDCKRWTEFLDFLRQVRRRFPTGRLYVVLDNYGPHQKTPVASQMRLGEWGSSCIARFAMVRRGFHRRHMCPRFIEWRGARVDRKTDADNARRPGRLVMPDFPAISHVAVTVSDLARSTRWYTALIGSDPVLDEDESKGAYHHTVWALPSGQLFGIHTHQAASGAPFDETNVGLDHVSFSCATRAELEEWTGRLEELGIKHSGIDDQHYGSGVSFRDPDGIALEFFAPPGT
jgi:catechol-2,3-dioxygenase